MMKLITKACISLVLFSGCVYGNQGGDGFECTALPEGKVPAITSFISADNRVNGTTICRMQYKVPKGADLWQGMLAARQQHGHNFTFRATINPTYGHFITTINGVTGTARFFWAIFDATGVATPVGVDWITLQDGAAYIFNYQYDDPKNHTIKNYTGMCLKAPSIPPNMPLAYLSVFLTVFDKNTESVMAGTNFKPVCQQLVLFDRSQPSLYDVMMLVNDQIPLDIKVTLNPSDGTVVTLNNITNQGGYAWTPFNVTTIMTLPRDLSKTMISDGDQIGFVFLLVGHEDELMITLNSSGATIMMSFILLLSSALGAFSI